MLPIITIKITLFTVCSASNQNDSLLLYLKNCVKFNALSKNDESVKWFPKIIHNSFFISYLICSSIKLFSNAYIATKVWLDCNT